MAVIMKLKYIDELSGGRKRFRRRWPKDVAVVRGETFFQKPLKARSGPAMVTEWETQSAEFEAIVAAHRRSLEERESMSPRALWREALQEAQRLLDGAHGGDEVVRRELAEDIAHHQVDPMLYRAVIQPEAAPPAYTLADAFDLYEREKIDESQGRGPRNRLARVRKKTEQALGKLSKLPIADLRRQHGRKLLDYLQSSTTSTGKSLSAGTIRREFDLVRALTEFALVEFDLVGAVANPFRKLEVKTSGAAPTVDRKPQKCTAGEGAPIQRRRNQFPKKEAVQKAADSELKRLKRAGRSFSVNMKGAPDAKAEAILQPSGFRSYIDGDWLITRAVHTLDSGGYQPKIEAEPLE
ncbi:hypothetical protein [Pseudophaeobacter sp.]|uniref:hypothetical protein n=1 Tax=Pseudophaeobacter sp. TaxID=1971739 RepID=UPI0032987A80